jgi:ABC-type uncharacterized transport system substrate-binding protein
VEGLGTSAVKDERRADLRSCSQSKFDLVINLKAAKAFGLDVPWHLQQRADEAIE